MLSSNMSQTNFSASKGFSMCIVSLDMLASSCFQVEGLLSIVACLLVREEMLPHRCTEIHTLGSGFSNYTLPCRYPTFYVLATNTTLAKCACVSLLVALGWVEAKFVKYNSLEFSLSHALTQHIAYLAFLFSFP